jgi:hypothetical protein
MCDRAQVNLNALATLRGMFLASVAIACLCHTLNWVGENFTFEHLENFMTAWFSLQRCSDAKAEWKKITGLNAPTCSDTRWWSWQHATKHVWAHRHHLPAFIKIAEVCMKLCLFPCVFFPGSEMGGEERGEDCSAGRPNNWALAVAPS